MYSALYELYSYIAKDFPKRNNIFLVLDIGQVWGWGYGGEGQLGLGSRIRMVSSPHPVPCIDSSSLRKERAIGLSHGCPGSEGQGLRVPGNYIKRIACGGRHSAVITDAGALLTFGWGLYGQVSFLGSVYFIVDLSTGVI